MLPTKTIFDLGFDRLLNKSLNSVSTGLVYDPIGSSLNVAQMLSGGSLSLKSLSVGGLVRQVAPGDDIQAAIDAVSREGGGVVQLFAKQYVLSSGIELRKNVSLVGAGRDATLLDFAGTGFGVICKGTLTTTLENFSIYNLTVQNSNAIAGIDLDRADFFEIKNVRITSCDQNGIRVQRSQRFSVELVRSDNNTQNGFFLFGELASNRQMRYFVFKNCQADSNSQIGFALELGWAINDQAREFTFENCTSTSNTGDGFDITQGGSSTFEELSVFLNCQSLSNGGIGFDIHNMANRVFIACLARDNTGDGFEITSGTDSIYIGCISLDNTGTDWDLNSTPDGTYIGCDLESGSSLVPSNLMTVNGLLNANMSGIKNGSFYHSREIVQMKNESGATSKSGAVAIFSTSNPAEGVNTTSTNGDNKVIGLFITSGIANNSFTNILTRGNTSNLLVSNITSSIVVGDWLSAYSHAYYAKEAIAGDMAFAIALSTPTTSTAAINALLVSPRLI